MPGVDGLGDKERRDVDECLVDLNRSAAYLRAGYKPGKSPTITSKMASDLFARPRIQAEVERLVRERDEKAGSAAERVVRELAKVGFASMRRFVQIDDRGWPRIDLRGADEDAPVALAEVSTSPCPCRRHRPRARAPQDRVPSAPGNAMQRPRTSCQDAAMSEARAIPPAGRGTWSRP